MQVELLSWIICWGVMSSFGHSLLLFFWRFGGRCSRHIYGVDYCLKKEFIDIVVMLSLMSTVVMCGHLMRNIFSCSEFRCLRGTATVVQDCDMDSRGRHGNDYVTWL